MDFLDPKNWAAAGQAKLVDIGELTPDAKNSRTHGEKQIAQIAESMTTFGWTIPVLTDERGGIIAGHGRILAAQKLGIKQAPVISAKGWTKKQKRAYIIADNQLALGAGWDHDILGAELQELRELDFNMDALGFDFSGLDDFLKDAPDRDPLDGFLDDAGRTLDDTERPPAHETQNEYTDQGEHEEAHQSAVEGEVPPVDSEEYLEFLKKFEEKKTTDDCYTPPQVYDALKNWALDEYDLKGLRIVRPFKPGGDYTKEDYSGACVVIDNPPFSILAEITEFYLKNGIKYLLFAPALTLFSAQDQCAIVVKCSVVYDNGANVATGFLTNLDESRVRTAPALNKALNDAVKAIRESQALPSYDYPANAITAAGMQYLALAEFKLSRAEASRKISGLDSQREHKKSMFGGGFLISDAAAERLEAAKIKADELKEAAEKEERERMVWELSEREQEIIEGLNNDS